MSCPDPLQRAPRVSVADDVQRERLLLPPPALQGALVAAIWRDIRGVPFSDAQRLSHIPASPLLTLSWFRDFDVGFIERDGQHVRWQALGSDIMLAGSQSHPLVSWAPSNGCGGMLCFTTEVARTLFGIDPAAVHDRCVDARAVLDHSWSPMFDALIKIDQASSVNEVLQQHLAPRWQALQGRSSAAPSLSQVGRHWVAHLSWKAMEWARTNSARQVERRIKAYSGRSLREWHALTRTEGLFFAARARGEAGQPFDWAELAAEQGFADQSHLIRSARRITGFAPAEFADRFVHDESFWLYRLWV